MHIPNYFDNFKQRDLARGIETCSTTVYKGYSIFMRAYRLSGIKYEIYRIIDEKKIIYRSRRVQFANPLEFLNHAKEYIDKNLDIIE